jgi:hypothetical protein
MPSRDIVEAPVHRVAIPRQARESLAPRGTANVKS